jgi:hypothetical protein
MVNVDLNKSFIGSIDHEFEPTQRSSHWEVVVYKT